MQVLRSQSPLIDRDRLGGVKTPKSVEFVDSIPRTAAGKMDKKALRLQHWGANVRMVN